MDPFQVVDEDGGALPEALGRVRREVARRVPGLVEGQDRRGFRLQQWPGPRAQAKPIELSLEHEARLKAAGDGAAALLAALVGTEGRPVGERLLPGDAELGGLIVEAYVRPPGPQSLDRYYELRDAVEGTGLIPRLFTLRERLVTSPFMTWAAGAGDFRPLNLELPFVAVGDSGVTARLELNWIDDLATSWREATDPDAPHRATNPIFLAMQVAGMPPGEVTPLLEHATVRRKFGLRDASEGRERYAINVDFVTSRDLRTGHSRSYVDIDISASLPIDGAELGRLVALTRLLSARYDLRPNRATKALRDLGGD